MTSRAPFAVLVIFALASCNGQLDQQSAPTSASTGGDAGRASDASDASTATDAFVCAPPATAPEAAVTFSGTIFDSARGCLTGTSTTLPVCGCFDGAGLDSSTWCFVDPAGTAYFATSADQCDVQMPPGWYATQSFGPSPWGSPTAAQASACAAVTAASTAMATYDRLGPPACTSAEAGAPTDAAASPTEAGVCVYPASASTGDDGGAGCRPTVPGQICTEGGAEGTACTSLCDANSYELTCSSSVAEHEPIPSPDPALGCTIIPIPTPPTALFYCCPCAS